MNLIERSTRHTERQRRKFIKAFNTRAKKMRKVDEAFLKKHPRQRDSRLEEGERKGEGELPD